MKETIEKVRVAGKGNSKKTAFAAALNGVQTEVLKNTEDIVLRIEPNNITVVKAEEVHWTEKFLFFFFPRQRVNFQVTLDIEVKCQRIKMEEVDFTLTENKPEGLRIPIINKYI